MIRLGVNIDHCATLREARYRNQEIRYGGIVEPDLLVFAKRAEMAGADGITVHPREDSRHVQRQDVEILKHHLQVPLNMEMAASAELADFALKLSPAAVCIVPESREEITTEGGLDAAGMMERLQPIIERLAGGGIRVSLFIDPQPKQVQAAAKLGAHCVELHTGGYANAYADPRERSEEFHRILEVGRSAREADLELHLGHGINYLNVRELCRVPEVSEMNIGHAIVSRALFVGIEVAVAEMRAHLNR